jgi:putative ABC transport system permease protein
MSSFATGNAMVKFANEKTNPTVLVFGVDQDFIPVRGYDIEAGRDFTASEHEHGANKAILGMELVNILFDKNPERAINQVISIGNLKFRVVGVLKSRGASMSQSADRRILIPLLTEKNHYGYTDKNYDIIVGVQNAVDIDDAISTAIATLRPIRKLTVGEENDFEMFKSEGLLEVLKENTVKIRMATIAIGLITLLGAAIGLMNIMLVSVTERTQEIGITKALGATRRNILTQFLIEAIIICQMGGIVGILLGVGIGNIVAQLIGGKFLMPWAWILLGIVTCMIVGLVSGLYPALKAARLDPIEALRYE